MLARADAGTATTKSYGRATSLSGEALPWTLRREVMRTLGILGAVEPLQLRHMAALRLRAAALAARKRVLDGTGGGGGGGGGKGALNFVAGGGGGGGGGGRGGRDDAGGWNDPLRGGGRRALATSMAAGAATRIGRWAGGDTTGELGLRSAALGLMAGGGAPGVIGNGDAITGFITHLDGSLGRSGTSRNRRGGGGGGGGGEGDGDGVGDGGGMMEVGESLGPDIQTLTMVAGEGVGQQQERNGSTTRSLFSEYRRKRRYRYPAAAVAALLPVLNDPTLSRLYAEQATPSIMRIARDLGAAILAPFLCEIIPAFLQVIEKRHADLGVMFTHLGELVVLVGQSQRELFFAHRRRSGDDRTADLGHEVRGG